MTSAEIMELLKQSKLKWAVDPMTNHRASYFISGKQDTFIVRLCFNDANEWYWQTKYISWNNVSSIEEAVRCCEEAVAEFCERLEKDLFG